MEFIRFGGGGAAMDFSEVPWSRRLANREFCAILYTRIFVATREPEKKARKTKWKCYAMKRSI